jgi:hypothetical protein
MKGSGQQEEMAAGGPIPEGHRSSFRSERLQSNKTG